MKYGGVAGAALRSREELSREQRVAQAPTAIIEPMGSGRSLRYATNRRNPGIGATVGAYDLRFRRKTSRINSS